MGWAEVSAACAPRLAAGESLGDLMPYEVRSGDTLGDLKRRSGLQSLEELRRLNPCLPQDVQNLTGSVLTVPRARAEASEALTHSMPTQMSTQAVPAPASTTTPGLSGSFALSWARETHMFPSRQARRPMADGNVSTGQQVPKTGDSLGGQLQLTNTWPSGLTLDGSLIAKGFKPANENFNYLFTAVGTIQVPLANGPAFKSSFNGYVGAELAGGSPGHRVIGGFSTQSALGSTTAFNLTVSAENNMEWFDRRESWMTGVAQPTMSHQLGPVTLSYGLNLRVDGNFGVPKNTMGSIALFVSAQATTPLGTYTAFASKNLLGETREPDVNANDVNGQTPGNERFMLVGEWKLF